MPIVPSPIVARSDAVRPVTNTLAPCVASSPATPLPMPRLPPVTTATWPFSTRLQPSELEGAPLGTARPGSRDPPVAGDRVLQRAVEDLTAGFDPYFEGRRNPLGRVAAFGRGLAWSDVHHRGGDRDGIGSGIHRARRLLAVPLHDDRQIALLFAHLVLAVPRTGQGMPFLSRNRRGQSDDDQNE